MEKLKTVNSENGYLRLDSFSFGLYAVASLSVRGKLVDGEGQLRSCG